MLEGRKNSVENLDTIAASVYDSLPLTKVDGEPFKDNLTFEVLSVK